MGKRKIRSRRVVLNFPHFRLYASNDALMIKRNQRFKILITGGGSTICRALCDPYIDGKGRYNIDVEEVFNSVDSNSDNSDTLNTIGVL